MRNNNNPFRGRRKIKGFKARNIILILIVCAICPFTIFSFFHFRLFSGEKSFDPILEWERGDCQPNFRPLRFSKYEGSEGYYFDSYIVGKEKKLKMILVPFELTKKSHFKDKFPFPPPQLLVRLFHHGNTTELSKESTPLNTEVVVCPREICAATNHEYFRSMAYTHIYSCNVPSSFNMDEYLEHGLHFSIQRDKEKDNIYFASDCTGLPKYRFTATTLLKNERENVGIWIRYLMFVGFDHIYIYDHGSTDGTIEYIEKTFSRDKVTVWDASNRFKIPKEDYMRKQALQLTDTVHRLYKNDWIINIDVDEYPVFFPNLHKFVSKFGGDEDVGSLLLPSVQYSDKKANKYADNYLEKFTDYSTVVSPYDILPLDSVVQQRTKALFRPQRMLCAFPHTVCSDDPTIKHHYLSVSESYFSHFYRRKHPMPYNGKVYYFVSYYEKMDKWDFNKVNTKYAELVKAYCPEDVGRCFKDEMEINDPELIRLKKEKIVTRGYQVKDTDRKDLLSRLRNYHCPKDLLYKV